jgi:hypothetical protein
MEDQSMARNFNDTTSTCGSCTYWSHIPEADGIHATRLGYCQWHTLPAWAYKPYKKLPISDDMRKMREDGGNDPGNPCWCHTKREARVGGETLLREVSLRKGSPDSGDEKHGG